MPDWFNHLAIDVMRLTSSMRHFGSSWEEQSQENPNQIILETSRAGIYNVMITARRKDDCPNCPADVEYIKKPEPEAVLPEGHEASTPCHKHPQ